MTPAFLVILDEQEGLALKVFFDDAMFQKLTLYEMYVLVRASWPGYRVEYPESS